MHRKFGGSKVTLDQSTPSNFIRMEKGGHTHTHPPQSGHCLQSVKEHKVGGGVGIMILEHSLSLLSYHLLARAEGLLARAEG